MGIRFDVWISCNKCGETVFCDGNISATHARQIAKAAGWRPSASHGDLCPACVERRSKPVESIAPPPPDDNPVRLRAAAERDTIEQSAPPEGWGLLPVEGWPV